MRRKRISRVRSLVYHVAVVLRPGLESGRPDKDWGSFVDTNAATAIERAIAAKARWEAKGYGPYEIYTGTLTESVTLPMNWKLTKLKAGD